MFNAVNFYKKMFITIIQRKDNSYSFIYTRPNDCFKKNVLHYILTGFKWYEHVMKMQFDFYKYWYYATNLLPHFFLQIKLFVQLNN